MTFFLRLKFHEKIAIFYAKTSFFGERLKFCGKFTIFSRRSFFLRKALVRCALGPWPRAFTVLGLERVCPRKVGPLSRVFCVLDLDLEPCVLESTSGFVINGLTNLCLLMKKREVFIRPFFVCIFKGVVNLGSSNRAGFLF